MEQEGFRRFLDREHVRRAQTGHFPSMQGAKAADSAVLESDDDDSYGCTRLVHPQGHSSPSASQRESSAESAEHR
ncbi:Trissin receptor [Dissostichus eleginoides]|uniref:Trissin receptor n=1 Tax=Dissostichus eleginoides TaxID=100907 RepID=A0AAD9BML2_DISEL|nr:Trissin receptor [Dissostichus eleginoides]